MQALGAARASLQSAVAARDRADAQLRHANARLKVRARASVRARGLWSGLGLGLGRPVWLRLCGSPLHWCYPHAEPQLS